LRHLRQEGTLRVKKRDSWIKRKRREEGRESGGLGQTVWMVTFSDLCTLLLTFFVLLLSMSSLNQRALRIAFNNFTASSGTLYFNRHERVHLMEDTPIRELCEGLESI
jgi:chemotaxis protein MotB